MKSKIIVLVLVLSLAVFSVNCSDFLTGGILDTNPNTADVVSMTSKVVALQTVGWGVYLFDAGYYSSLWMQYMTGLANQQSDHEIFNMNQSDFGGIYTNLYISGGLIDIKSVKAEAEELGLRHVLGITKMYEALLFATGADLFGALPYTEAVVEGIEHPVFDTQLSIHNACLALLDEAIADLNAATDTFDARYDFSFGSDKAHMIAAIHSLKARILLNWAEVNNGNYALALAEAQLGINSLSENWTVPFNDTGTEQNLWYQLVNNRGNNYVKPAAHIVELMKAKNDARLPYYFDKDPNGEYSGGPWGELFVDGSDLAADTYFSAGWDLDIISYEENLFMIAECQYNTGSEAAALATLNTALGVSEDKFGMDADSITRYSGLTGTDLLEAIMHEKYIALFLSPQTWNDWKRTGYPQLTTGPGLEQRIPRRYMYPDDVYSTNDNAPASRGIHARNANDPGDPSYLSKK